MHSFLKVNILNQIFKSNFDQNLSSNIKNRTILLYLKSVLDGNRDRKKREKAGLVERALSPSNPRDLVSVCAASSPPFGSLANTDPKIFIPQPPFLIQYLLDRFAPKSKPLGHTISSIWPETDSNAHACSATS